MASLALNPAFDHLQPSLLEKSTGLPLRKDFWSELDGKKIDLFFLKNKHNLQAAITNYGGRIAALLYPDKDGRLTDVVLGFDSLDQFISSSEPYFNTIIGRYGNRIANGRFKLDGKEYSLFLNNGPNTLHGGKKGFQHVVWEANQLDEQTLELTYFSKDGEEGFPGNLIATITYSLTDLNELKIEYKATTDKKTVINLTNHAYFNLNGNGTILNHLLEINTDYYTPVDATLIPLGYHQPVANTPFDFTIATKIGSKIEQDNIQLKNGEGYDHNFVLNQSQDSHFNFAASVLGDKSKIFMEVFTEEPGLQFYSGNFMKGENAIKGGKKDEFRTAFALETQHFPDSPNQFSFPSTILIPDQVYQTSTIYRFSIKKDDV